MSDRPTDELVANLAYWAADAKPTTREVEALAREVQASRKLIADLRALLMGLAISVPSSMEIEGFDGDADWLIRDAIRLIDEAGV
jgi:hypothetical protein